ncbi:MAG: hypothetical protein IKP96_05775 [Elusimicrobiaceae bacterium]|nr:hypothetical protein [Elusimicrobiaceae bacterium]
MKKILIVLLLICCTQCGFAQNGTHAMKAALGAGAKMNALVSRDVLWMREYASLMTRLEQSQLVPLQFADKSVSVAPKLVVPAQNVYKKTIVPGEILSLEAKEKDALEEWELNSYFRYLTDTKSMNFIFRGMKLANLKEIEHILLHGLETSKAGGGVIYMSTSLTQAKIYSEIRKEGIPVIVAMDIDSLLMPIEESVYKFDYRIKTDIPRQSIFRVLAFLNIDGKTAWYRVEIPPSGMVFLPLPGNEKLFVTE